MAWEKFYILSYFEQYKSGNRSFDENFFLNFKEICPFFLILVFGFTLAGLTLWCEIFHRDFVSQLSKEFFRRIFRRNLKVRPKVKFVKVKPAQKVVKPEKN